MTNNNTWVSFGSKITTTDSTFSMPVAGSTLSQGAHAGVTITAIEPGGNPDYPAVKVTFEKNGETKNKSVFFLNYEKDGFSNDYLALAAAAISDPLLRQEFFGKKIPNNPALLNSLIGTTVNITIDYKKVKVPGTKYKIKNLNDGQFALVDAFDDTEIEDIVAVYSSYTDAKDAATENNLKLSYMEVLRITGVSDAEIRATQDQKFQELLTNGNKPKVVGTTF